MATWSWPPPSRAARMAATCPSIMPLGRHDVRTRFGLRQRDPPVELEGRVVEDLAVGPEHAAVAVVRVLVETEVGHEDELVSDGVAQRAQGALDDPLRVVRLASRWRPSSPAPRRGSARGRRARPGAWPRPPGSRWCAGPARAWMRSGTGPSIPSRTNRGAIRSSTPRRASATSRRRAGVRRSRRNRRTGKAGPASSRCQPTIRRRRARAEMAGRARRRCPPSRRRGLCDPRHARAHARARPWSARCRPPAAGRAAA